MSGRLIGVVAVVVAAVLLAGGAVAAGPPPNLPPQANLPNRHVCAAPAPIEAACSARVVTNADGTPFASSGPVGYGPTQFQKAYALPSSTAGTGQTIGIVDAYDDPTAASDLAKYSAQFGLPVCGSGCFTKVNQTGGTTYPSANGGWALEISLDIEIAHAVCPACKILLVEASSNSYANLFAAEDYAAAHANVVSNSWGGSESSSETGYDTSHFSHYSVPITVSSGDNGYGVEFPASSQYVTAVGGTTLKLNADNTRATETAWSGSGSGCSAYEPKPSWQHDPGCARRTVADVSADADPNTGAAVYDSTRYCTFLFFGCSSGWFQVGGTSLASPLVAAVYALAGDHLSLSVPYGNPGLLNDVTSGSNGSCGGSYLCTAGGGYDGPTGLGSPNGTGGF